MCTIKIISNNTHVRKPMLNTQKGRPERTISAYMEVHVHYLNISTVLKRRLKPSSEIFGLEKFESSVKIKIFLEEFLKRILSKEASIILLKSGKFLL
ncbi:hypothetical protein H8356DRAFT_1335888 [Neocallimastix lanati (nom. inval.)]|nr:hypothetical protein H8356DRAFT_1335888 [Neocallimastix sp. JGI-2020a]